MKFKLLTFLLFPYLYLTSQSLLDSFNTSVYIWSREFKTMTIGEITALLLKYKVNQAFVSDNANPLLRSKREMLAHALKGNGIKVANLIGYNHWLRMSDEELLETIKKLPQGPFHIDIEPHALSDWIEQKSYYENRYLKILVLLHQKGEISVAIPFHFSKDFINLIYQITPHCYIMAYGVANMSVWERRLDDEYIASKGQMAICLSVHNFVSAEELVNTVRMFRQQFSCTTIALHDLKGLVKLH